MKLALSLTLTLAGCASSAPQRPSGFEPDSGDSTTEVPEAEAVVGAEGAKVTLAGVTLDVPPGALTAEVTLTVEVTDLSPEGYRLASPVYRFGPEGTRFAQPVTITLPVEGATEGLVLHWSTPVGGWQAIRGTARSPAAIRAPVSHFSTGFAAPPGPQTEVFDVQDALPLDVLLVVDDSCSMTEEQAKLANNFTSFLDPVVATGLDWHVGVITTDMDAPLKSGRLQGSDGYRFLDGAASDRDAVFARMVTRGTGGSADERGLAAAYQALTMPTTALKSANADFLRDDSQVVVMVFSDEDDQSSTTVTRNEFIDFLTALRETSRPQFVPIVGPAPTGCKNAATDAQPGTAYLAVANALGSAVGSICDADWDPVFTEVLATVDATACFPLGLDADAASIEVFLHPSGDLLAEDAWRYDPGANCVALTVPGWKVAGTSTLGVRYDPAGP